MGELIAWRFQCFSFGMADFIHLTHICWASTICQVLLYWDYIENTAVYKKCLTCAHTHICLFIWKSLKLGWKRNDFLTLHSQSSILDLLIDAMDVISTPFFKKKIIYLAILGVKLWQMGSSLHHADLSFQWTTCLVLARGLSCSEACGTFISWPGYRNCIPWNKELLSVLVSESEIPWLRTTLWLFLIGKNP